MRVRTDFDFQGEAPKQRKAIKRCLHPRCTTTLNSYNFSEVCSPHRSWNIDRKEKEYLKKLEKGAK